MENLENAVVEVASNEVCSIKKASKVLLPVAAVVGLGLLVVTLFKRSKAKKAVANAQAEEVNPDLI